MRKNALALVCALSIPCSAAPLPARITLPSKQIKKAESRLREWIESQPEVRKSVTAAIERESAWHPAPDPDLRDAVSDSPYLRDRIQVSQGKKREAMLSSLPGMKIPEAPSCSDLKDCAMPPLALDVEDSAHLRLAIRSLIRPWIMLEQSRGGIVGLEAADDEGDKIMTFSIPDLSLQNIGVNVTAKPEGGFHVWLDQPLVLSSIYSQHRDEALGLR